MQDEPTARIVFSTCCVQAFRCQITLDGIEVHLEEFGQLS